MNIDHRRGTSIAPGAIPELLTAAWNVTSDLNNFVEAVHRLDNLGGVVTHVANETSQEGFHAEWRVVSVFTVEGDMVNRCEVFDEAAIDDAIARFEQLSRPAPRLENAASQVTERFAVHLAARDWDAMAELLADDFCSDDRRGVVGAGIQHGRDADMADMRTIIDLWITNVSSTIIATRGEHLVLVRTHFSGSDQGPGAFLTEVFGLVEIDTDERIVAIVTFELGDFAAALTELDARYLAGEAAAYAHTWSVIADGHAALNRHELPPTTPDCVSIDHRRGAAFAPGDLIEYFRAGWELGQDIRTYVEVVHRLSELGAVCTHAGHGVSHEGFDAEWHGVDLLTVEGDMVNRCEAFDDADLDAALARFDQLSRPTPRLENTASRANARFVACFNARDWETMASILADDSLQRRPAAGNRRRNPPRSGCRDREHAGGRRSRGEYHGRGHRDSRRPPCSHSYPRLVTRSKGSSLRRSSSSRPTSTAVSRRPSCSTSRTPQQPSKNSTRITSPAKRPLTRARGRSSRGLRGYNRRELP